MKTLRLGALGAVWAASMLVTSSAQAQVDPSQAFYAIAFTHGSPHNGVITAQRLTSPFDVVATAARGTVNGTISLDPVRGVLYGGSCCTPNLPVQAYDPVSLARVPARDINVVTSGSLALEVDAPRRVLFLYDTVNRTVRAYSLTEGSAYGTVVASTTLTDLLAEPVATSAGDQIAVDTRGQQLVLTGGDGGPVITVDISPITAAGGTFGAVRYTGQRNRTTSNSGGGVAVDEAGRRIFFFPATGTVRMIRADAPFDMLGEVTIPSMAANDCGLFFDARTSNLYVGRGASAPPVVVSFPSMSVTPFATGPGDVPALSFAGATTACVDRDGDGFFPAACAATGARVDCDDTRREVNPGATETCNTVDDDCDGLVDDGFCRVGDACVADGAANPANVCEVCAAPATMAAVTRWSPRARGFECRPSAGVCDAAEACDGAGACPVDGFLASTTECRASAGVCDVAESCTGSSAACPTDAFRPSSAECRASAGVCDVAESCTGSGAECPSDAFAAATVVCRVAATTCDLAESCTGSGAACPADMMARTPVEELCDNSVDDDCDGMIDERPCAGGDAGTTDVADVSDASDGSGDPPADATVSDVTVSDVTVSDVTVSDVSDAGVVDASDGSTQFAPDAHPTDASKSDVATSETGASDATADTGPNGGNQGGCGCSVPASRGERGAGLGVMFAVVAMLRRRRRVVAR